MNVLVTGAESTGTEMVTSLLASQGADAVHRSVPAGSEWLLPPGPWDAIIVCHRHGPVAARSQVYRGHATTEPEALSRMARGYGLVYAYAELVGCIVVPVTYEALVYEGHDAFGMLLDLLEIPRCDTDLGVRNENAKWYPQEARG